MAIGGNLKGTLNPQNALNGAKGAVTGGKDIISNGAKKTVNGIDAAPIPNVSPKAVGESLLKETKKVGVPGFGKEVGFIVLRLRYSAALSTDDVLYLACRTPKQMG